MTGSALELGDNPCHCARGLDAAREIVVLGDGAFAAVAKEIPGTSGIDGVVYGPCGHRDPPRIVQG